VKGFYSTGEVVDRQKKREGYYNLLVLEISSSNKSSFRH